MRLLMKTDSSLKRNGVDQIIIHLKIHHFLLREKFFIIKFHISYNAYIKCSYKKDLFTCSSQSHPNFCWHKTIKNES